MIKDNIALACVKDDKGAEHVLAPVCTVLTNVVAACEDDFITLGMSLQQVQIKSSASRSKIAGAMRLFRGEGEADLLGRIAAYVQSSQEQTAGAQQTATDLCERLAGMVNLIDSISRKSEALERSGLLLRVIGINTGIECARYSQLESIFKVVARETIDLSEQVHNVTRLLLDRASKARQEQCQTLDGARNSIRDLEQLSAGTRNVTRTALEKVEQLVDYSVATVDRAEQTAARVTAEINQVVMGIQFHDNLRQRIEHITTALLEIDEPQLDDDKSRLCDIYLAMELQKSQLDSVINELDDLYATQSQALTNIINEVSVLQTGLQEMVAEQSTNQHADNPLVALLRGITALKGLNSDSARLSSRIRASAAEAEQIADDMQEAIRGTFTVTIHIKMNALNAIIKAAKSGHYGMALQVLAQSMVEVSNDTRVLVDVFEELISELHRLVRGDGDLDPSQALVGDNVQEFDSEGMQLVFSDFHGQLLEVRSECAVLAQDLSRELQKLCFIQSLKEALQQAIDLLMEQIAHLPELDQELLAGKRTDFGAKHQQRYTMEKERSIHNQVKQGVVVASAGSVAAADAVAIDLWGGTVDTQAHDAAPVDINSTGDSIDLWDTDTPAASDDVDLRDGAAPALQELDVATGGSVDLWDNDPLDTEDDLLHTEVDEEIREPVKKNKEDEDFGDNVELF